MDKSNKQKNRIGKERTPGCWFCHANTDTVEHTVSVCPKWRKQRQRLIRRIGPDLTLPTLVREILQDDRRWAAFQRFADAVLKAKEEAERRQRGVLGFGDEGRSKGKY